MLYLAEFYLPGGVSSISELACRARAAAPPAGAGSAGLVLAIHVPDDETCFALYDAQAADAVMSAGARAGIAFERVAAAILSWPPQASPYDGCYD
jgi:hypothetical protein